MSVSYNPPAVTSGLVLSYDAANSKSYTGAGTTWIDLTGNGNNGALTNGPTFNSANGGSIVFDGSNDYVLFSAPGLSSIATVEMWVKLGAAYAGKMFMGWNGYDVWCNGGNIGYNTNNSDVYGISSATATSLGVVNNWKHYIFEFRSDVAYTNNKIYINAALQSLSQQASTENSSNRNLNSGNGAIASYRSQLIGYNMPMNCSIFKVYNRALTAAEILQNFNATRGRYQI